MIFGDSLKKLSRVYLYLVTFIYKLLNDFYLIFYAGIILIFFHAVLDILYLNKQRLWAVEELNRTNREKKILLGKIDQLEAEKQSLDVKGATKLKLLSNIFSWSYLL